MWLNSLLIYSSFYPLLLIPFICWSNWVIDFGEKSPVLAWRPAVSPVIKFLCLLLSSSVWGARILRGWGSILPLGQLWPSCCGDVSVDEWMSVLSVQTAHLWSSPSSPHRTVLVSADGRRLDSERRFPNSLAPSPSIMCVLFLVSDLCRKHRIDAWFFCLL